MEDQVCALWIDNSLSLHDYFSDSYYSSNATTATAAVVVAVVVPVSVFLAILNKWEISPNPAALPCIF